MMEKSIKKAVSLLIACCMLLSLAGCGGSQQTATTAAPANTATTQAEPTPVPEGPSWTWDTSPFEIREWYVGLPASEVIWDPVNTINHKAMFEKTGLQKLTYTSSPTAADEKLSAMIASNMLPDVITLNASTSREKIDLLQSNGLVEDLLGLIDQYAPTFKSDINPAIIDWWKTSDGKWYAFPNGTHTGREERPMGMGTQMFTFARKDIMEQLNLKPEDFKTQDGFVAALKKFKESGINNNGAAMLPMLMGEITNIHQFIADLSQIFGIKYENKEGQYITALQTPEYWEFARFMNRLYREGLLTDQNILMKTAEAKEIAAQNGFFLNFATNITMAPIKQQCQATNGAIYYVSTELPRSTTGQEPLFVSGGVSGCWMVTFISKNAKNKDRIIRFFEYLNSKEGNIQMFFGSEGVHYDWVEALVPQTGKVQKVIQVKEEYANELTADKVAAKKKHGTQQLFMLYDLKFIQSIGYQAPYEEKTIENKMETDIWDFNGKKGEGSSRYGVINDCVNANGLEPDPDSEAADIKAKINIYMQEQGMKLITAKSEDEFNNLYEDTMKKVTDMGLLKLQEVQNAKFQALKAKFGLKYSYPQLGK